jgi:hypothetical protein
MWTAGVEEAEGMTGMEVMKGLKAIRNDVRRDR